MTGVQTCALPICEAQVRVDGRFVGVAQLDPTAPGLELELPLGLEPGFRVRRSVVNREVNTSGNFKQVELDVRFVVDNDSARAESLRLYDRLPYAKIEGSVEVKLSSSVAALSADPSFVEKDKPRGILRYDLDLPAGGSRTLELAYRIRHDRNFHLRLARPRT